MNEEIRHDEKPKLHEHGLFLKIASVFASAALVAGALVAIYQHKDNVTRAEEEITQYIDANIVTAEKNKNENAIKTILERIDDNKTSENVKIDNENESVEITKESLIGTHGEWGGSNGSSIMTCH